MMYFTHILDMSVLNFSLTNHDALSNFIFSSQIKFGYLQQSLSANFVHSFLLLSLFVCSSCLPKGFFGTPQHSLWLLLVHQNILGFLIIFHDYLWLLILTYGFVGWYGSLGFLKVFEGQFNRICSLICQLGLKDLQSWFLLQQPEKVAIFF